MKVYMAHPSHQRLTGNVAEHPGQNEGGAWLSGPKRVGKCLFGHSRQLIPRMSPPAPGRTSGLASEGGRAAQVYVVTTNATVNAIARIGFLRFDKRWTMGALSSVHEVTEGWA